MGVGFNSKAAMAELRLRLIDAVKQLQGEFLNEARSGMRTPEGADSLYEGDVVALANVISAQVIGGANAALDNYGRGSLMAGPDENPNYEEYHNSDLWNPDREDDVIRSRARKRGPYVDIYGNRRKTNSNVGGIDLEKRGGKFAPREPSFALETAARWMENGRVQEVIAGVVEAMPWGNYFEEVKEG